MLYNKFALRNKHEMRICDIKIKREDDDEYLEEKKKNS